MPRKRMIDPNIWQSEDFASLSTLAKLVFIGLFSNADDEGRGRGKATYVKSILFPYDENMKSTDIDKTLTEISSKMSIVFYEFNGNEYYSLVNWSKWQRVDKPSPSNIPECTDQCKTIRRTIAEQSPNNLGLVLPNRIEEKRREKKRSEDARATIKYADFVSMTNDEYSSLVAKLGERGAKRAIEIMDNYKGANGKQYKSDYRAILNWVVKRLEEENAKGAENATSKYANIQGITRL